LSRTSEKSPVIPLLPLLLVLPRRLFPVEPRSAGAIAALEAARLPMALEACWATALPVSLKRLVVLLRKAPRLDVVCDDAAPGVAVALLSEESEVEVELVVALFPSRLVEAEDELPELELELDELLLELEELVAVVVVLALPASDVCRPLPLRLPLRRGAIRLANRSAWITPATRTVFRRLPNVTGRVRVVTACAWLTRAARCLCNFQIRPTPARATTVRINP
jgi:hypothetical protein